MIPVRNGRRMAFKMESGQLAISYSYDMSTKLRVSAWWVNGLHQTTAPSFTQQSP